MNSTRTTTSPNVAVRCPWTGECIVYHEKAYGHPDDMLRERGIRLGFINAPKVKSSPKPQSKPRRRAGRKPR